MTARQQSAQQYYADHRGLTAARRARPASLEASRARAALPAVPPQTQAAWLAQLARLDDPHTAALALKLLPLQTLHVLCLRHAL